MQRYVLHVIQDTKNSLFVYELNEMKRENETEEIDMCHLRNLEFLLNQ